MRMHVHQIIWLTNAYTKKFANHLHMVGLSAAWYNFVRVHKSLRVSPVVAAGISDRRWSMEGIVAVVEAADAPGKEARDLQKQEA